MDTCVRIQVAVYHLFVAIYIWGNTCHTTQCCNQISMFHQEYIAIVSANSSDIARIRSSWRDREEVGSERTDPVGDTSSSSFSDGEEHYY